LFPKGSAEVSGCLVADLKRLSKLDGLRHHGSALPRAAAAMGMILVASVVSRPALGDEPTYQIAFDRDVPVLAVATTLWLLPAFAKTSGPASCAPACDPANINAFDRPAAGSWRPGWARASDVGAASLYVGGALALMLDEGIGTGLSDEIVVAQSFAAAGALASLTSAAARRPRPFLYGDIAPLDDRLGANAALSFFSGHTATSFAAAAALFRTLQIRHPRSPVPWIVLGVSLGTAGFVGTGRVLSGNHFPSDVIVGAVVGSSTGLLFPALHATGLTIAPTADGQSAGLRLFGQF
jgi:membrane-associated phospholipid phosphatase